MSDGPSRFSQGLMGAANTVANYFMQVEQQKREARLKQGNTAQVDARDRITRLEAVLNNPDEGLTDAQRANAAQLIDQYQRVVGADTEEAASLWEEIQGSTGKSQSVVEAPIGKGGRVGTPADDGTERPLGRGARVGTPADTGVTEETMPGGRPVNPNAQRTAFETQTPEAFLTSLERDNARAARAAVEQREDFVFSQEQMAKLTLANTEGDIEKALAVMARETGMSIEAVRFNFQRQLNTQQLTSTEQLELYKGVKEVVADMRAADRSPEDIQAFISSTSLADTYKQTLGAEAKVGAIVNVNEALTNPALRSVLAANVSAALNPDGTFDMSKLSRSEAEWVAKNPGAAKLLRSEHGYGLHLIQTGIQGASAEVVAKRLANRQTTQGIDQAATLHQKDLEQIDRDIANAEFASSDEKVNTVIATGNRALYGKLTADEKQAVDAALTNSGTSLEERGKAFVKDLQEASRAGYLANEAVETGIELTDVQISTQQYQLQRAQVFDGIKDSATIQSMVFTAAREGDAGVLMYYRNVLDNPDAYPEQYAALQEAGITRGRLDRLATFAGEVLTDTSSQIQHNRTMRESAIQSHKLNNYVLTEQTLSTFADTFETQEDLDSFLATPEGGNYLAQLGRGARQRLASIVNYNQRMGERADAARDVQNLMMHRPEVPGEWDKDLFIDRLVASKVDPKVAKQMADDLVDSWGREGAVFEQEARKSDALIRLHLAQAEQALASAANLRRPPAGATINPIEVAELELKRAELLMKGVEEAEANLMQQATGAGCLVSSPDELGAKYVVADPNKQACIDLNNQLQVQQEIRENLVDVVSGVGTRFDEIRQTRPNPNFPEPPPPVSSEETPGGTAFAPGAPEGVSIVDLSAQDETLLRQVSGDLKSGNDNPESLQRLQEMYPDTWQSKVYTFMNPDLRGTRETPPSQPIGRAEREPDTEDLTLDMAP